MDIINWTSIRPNFISLETALHAETLATQRFQGNRITTEQQTSTHKVSLARGIIRTVEWLPVDERNTTETRQIRIPAEAKNICRAPRSCPGHGASGACGTTGHSPSMAMTRRHSGRNRVDNDMHALRKHRGDFIGGTAQRSSPASGSARRHIQKKERPHARRDDVSHPRKRCRPHWAAGKVKHGRARLSGLRFRPVLRSRSHRAVRRARRGRWGAPGRSSLRRRRLR